MTGMSHRIHIIFLAIALLALAGCPLPSDVVGPAVRKQSCWDDPDCKEAYSHAIRRIDAHLDLHCDEFRDQLVSLRREHGFDIDDEPPDLMLRGLFEIYIHRCTEWR